MSKRGQVSVFILIGLLIIAGIAAYVSIKRLYFELPASEAGQINQYAVEPQAITNYVEGCIEKIAPAYIYNMSFQGGTLELAYPTKLHYGLNYRYACLYEPDHNCVNQLFTRHSMEQELNSKLNGPIKMCINLEPYRRQDYEV